MKQLLLLVCLAVLLGAAPASGVQPSSPGAGGTVVFVSTRDGDSDIYAVNSDGTGLTQLTHDDMEDSEPVPSPDGRLIMFDGPNGPTVMNADGSGRRALRGCPGFRPGGWSPDSRRIVCSAYEERVVIVDTVDGTATPLVDSGEMPMWSPDGRTIAFIDERRLFVVPATGGARRRLGIQKVAEEAAPSWSPDSQRVAYVAPMASGLDRYALWTIRANGSGGRRILQNILEHSPTWSPDGSRIAFDKLLPHFVSAVWTVRTDGTGLHRVSGSRARESSQGPSWSADGRLLLYSRARFRASLESDIYAARPAGRGGHAVTHPFPAGGSNWDPQWLVGPRLSGGEQIPPTLAVSIKRRLSFPQPVGSIDTDGTRAIPVLLAEKQPALRIWDAATGRSMRGPVPCGAAGSGAYGPGQLALAGKRLAWTCSEAGNTFYAIGLMTFRLGDRRPKSVASASGDEDGWGTSIVDLIGRGNTIAFSNLHRRANEPETVDPWLLLAHKAKKCPSSYEFYRSRAVCRPLGRSDGRTMAIDAGRVLTVASSGLVRILSTRGPVLRVWNLGEGIVRARLRGNELAVQHEAAVDVYDTRTGVQTHTRQLLTDGGPQPLLLDVQGGLVLYATGGAIHLLRLSDGRDKALRLPAAAPLLDARLEPAGLFVSWNKMYDRRPGRLGFVPLRLVKARL
jgi:Tol biopolymer transport system component